ncbi:MAG: hypothetical protein NTZ44_00685 [Candidatus Nomurabacteria bacterium]|nr:hypothetical protein [Candidatus Nomurabacteria bacterium]
MKGMTFLDKIKQKFWRWIYSFFPSLQKWLLKTHLIWHEKGRQKYHIGWLAHGRTLEELKKHLHQKWGFGNHFVAWTDDGQVLSWRKLLDFQDQYHLRVFSDGEIRGHYELTPEAHPIAHFEEKGETHCQKEFVKFLGDFVTDKKPKNMHLTMDPNAWNPDSEITIDQVKN